MLRCGCRLVHVFMGGGSGGVGCGGVGLITSMALSHIRHYVMLCYCMSSSTSTHASCLHYCTVHQVKNFTSEGPKLFPGVSNIAGTQTLNRPWKSLNFLPAHMVLKCKERGHSTLHPSVTQCVFVWCWQSSLQSPDLEELEALL